LGAVLDRLENVLTHRAARLAGTGVILLVVAAVLLPNSVWTLPLVIVGVLMVLVAWIGSRLNGHCLIKWGESGTQVDFHAELTSARQRQAPSRRPTIAAVAAPADPGVIDGEAHTVEIDIGELKALIAAAEADALNKAADAAAGSFRARARRR
jgi:hypothetical protein